jgi:hypothetical protein
MMFRREFWPPFVTKSSFETSFADNFKINAFEFFKSLRPQAATRFVFESARASYGFNHAERNNYVGPGRPP